MSPVLNGLMRGAALGQMLRQAAMEREHMARQKARDEREAQMEDLRAQDLITRMGRPISAGMVEDGSFDAPGMAAAAPIYRKADPTRTVRYKTGDGRTVESELLTPAEQRRMAQQDHEAGLRSDLAIRGDAELEQLKKKAEFEASRGVNPTLFGLPDLGRKVPLSDIDSLARAWAFRENILSMIAQRAKPEDPVQTVQMQVDDLGNATPVIVRKSGKVEKGENLGAIGKKARPVKAGGGGGGEKPPSRAQFLSIEQRKQSRLKAAEAKFKGSLQLKDDEQALVAEKQAAEDAYAQELGALGIEASPVQYGPIRAAGSKAPAAPTPAAPAATPDRARNPKTGEVIEYRDGRWQPVR